MSVFPDLTAKSEPMY